MPHESEVGTTTSCRDSAVPPQAAQGDYAVTPSARPWDSAEIVGSTGRSTTLCRDSAVSDYADEIVVLTRWITASCLDSAVPPLAALGDYVVSPSTRPGSSAEIMEKCLVRPATDEAILARGRASQVRTPRPVVTNGRDEQ